MPPASFRILSPASGAAISSPLAILKVRYDAVTAPTATIRVGECVQYAQLAGTSGELRENLTLLEGRNHIEVEIDGERDSVDVELAPSQGIKLSGNPSSETPRALELSGSYEGCSCPAGVISCNGFMQQFAALGSAGSFAEKVVLRPGTNHVAVQIGERYATRTVKGAFSASKLVVTLLWDTAGTDVDLHVIEPSGASVCFRTKQGGGTLDIDRRSGFGPENYSLGGGTARVAPGVYQVRTHFYAGGGGFAAGGVARTEWTARVVIDEATPKERRVPFYGFLEVSNSNNSESKSSGPDWNDICSLELTASGDVRVK